MTSYLRRSSEFQTVYRNGKRYEGSLITAFVLPNNLPYNRFGITASRKAIGNAVQRNRARRLLRETFRLKAPLLGELNENYDWVFNAKRKLTTLKVDAAFEEFEKVVLRVAREESKAHTFG